MCVSGRHKKAVYLTLMLNYNTYLCYVWYHSNNVPYILYVSKPAKGFTKLLEMNPACVTLQQMSCFSKCIVLDMHVWSVALWLEMYTETASISSFQSVVKKKSTVCPHLHQARLVSWGPVLLLPEAHCPCRPPSPPQERFLNTRSQLTYTQPASTDPPTHFQFTFNNFIFHNRWIGLVVLGHTCRQNIVFPLTSRLTGALWHCGHCSFTAEAGHFASK